MQYENNMSSYQKKNTMCIKGEILSLVALFIIAVLISRGIVFVNINNVNGIAPFGVSFLMAIIMKRKYKYIFATFLGIMIGYFSFIDNISGEYIVMITSFVVFLYSCIMIKINKKISEKVIFFIMVVSYILYGFIIYKYSFGLNITLSLVNIAVIIPIYYVIKYGVKCICEFNNNYLFSAEDFFCIEIILCLIVAGFGNTNISNISFRTIAAYFVIIAISYVGGITYGSTIGLSMGVIVGISSDNLMKCTIFYGVIGLISGLFKQTGKVFVILSYIIIFMIISVYFQDLSIYSILEALIAGLLIMVIPNKYLKMTESEIDIYMKRERINNIELEEIKKQFTDKVKELTSTLQIVSNSLNNISDNENLLYKNKSAALIENLCQRVCSQCTRSKTCWERDFNLTYNSFTKLIRSCEENRIIFPHQLEKVCFEKFHLIRGADSLVTSLKSSEIFKQRLEEGRLIASKHISSVVDATDQLIQNFSRDIKIDSDLQRILRKALNRENIYPKRIFCYIDEDGRTKVKLNFMNCEGSSYCSKIIVPLISKVMNKKVEICNEGCQIRYKTGECSIVLTEAAKFTAISYAAGCTKSMERYSGDTYSFEKCKNGKYINIISDGMGYGPKASKNSLTTVKMIERYMEAGFSEKSAVNMINNVMSMKFDEDESFSTLDFNVIDLYSGKASFIKVGAVSSFIKRGKKIKVISSSAPPFGTVDELELDSVNVNIKNGDIIVMISDGIVDVDKKKLLDYTWLEDFLIDSTREPKKLAQDILDKSKEISGGNILDDMTVLVCKIKAEIAASM